MKANYNRKVKVRERAVCFRKKMNDGRLLAFCVCQNTVYDKFSWENDKDIIYLDCENNEQLDKLIASLQQLRDENAEETANESNEKPEQEDC